MVGSVCGCVVCVINMYEEYVGSMGEVFEFPSQNSLGVCSVVIVVVKVYVVGVHVHRCAVPLDAYGLVLDGLVNGV